MAPLKSVALAVTSYNGPFYDDGKKSGAFFSEVYDPWKYYTDKGWKVQIVSETGTFGWDEHSIEDANMPPGGKEALNDASGAFAQAVAAVKKASDVNPADFDVFFAAGGHGTIFDFNGKAPGVAALASAIWEKEGLVAAVCHGPVILPSVKGKDGKCITNGRSITGFADAGEELFGLVPLLKKNDWPTTYDLIKDIGTYVEPKPPLAETVVIDERLMTGANPASAEPLAAATVDYFKNK